MTSNTSFAEILNYAEFQEIPSTEVATIDPHPNAEILTNLEVDFEDARENLRELSDLTQEAVREMARLAGQLQEPRAYDALSKILATAVTANKAMVELHKNKIEGKDGAQPAATVTNNTLIMTTDELQKKLENAFRDA